MMIFVCQFCQIILTHLLSISSADWILNHGKQSWKSYKKKCELKFADSITSTRKTYVIAFTTMKNYR